MFDNVVYIVVQVSIRVGCAEMNYLKTSLQYPLKDKTRGNTQYVSCMLMFLRVITLKNNKISGNLKVNINVLNCPTCQ